MCKLFERLPTETRVKILYYLRFERDVLYELYFATPFRDLITIRDWDSNIVDYITYKNSAYCRALYHPSVRQLFTMQEYFPCTFYLRCNEECDFLFDDDY